jgi:hypothetical protein
MAELYCNDCFAHLWREDRKLPRKSRSFRVDLVARLHERSKKVKVKVEVSVRHYQMRNGVRIPSQVKCDPCHKRYLEAKPGLVEVK